MSETSKNNRGWKILRRILIALAIFVTLIAMLYAEEDWRGKRDWENYKHEWEAKGEKFDWQAFVPTTVPDDQNFFTAPIFVKIKNDEIAMTPYGNDGGPAFSSYKNSPTSEIGHLGGEGRTSITDLQAWQMYYRNPTNASLAKEFPIARQPQTPAKDVLFALSKFDPAVEELRQASQRPYANVALNYADRFNSVSTLLPILAELKRCTQLLQLRAVAELADGQNAKALEDVKLMLYLNNSLRNSPFFICHLVRIAIAAIGLQPIWEGLAKHAWSDAQLVALDAELSKIDFLNDYEFFMRGERAFAIAEFENQRRTHEIISSNEKGYVTNKLSLMPEGFFYQNELAFAQMDQDWLLSLVDTNARIISPENLRRVDAAMRLARKHYSIYKVQALMTIPVLDAAAKKVAAIQCSVDLARVACALERYRLAYGNFPDSLNVLAPQFIAQLPHDIINGQPLQYRRTDDGQFILYSVGWNEKDDGGKIALTKNGSPDRENGDWVWQYPKNN